MHQSNKSQKRKRNELQNDMFGPPTKKAKNMIEKIERVSPEQPNTTHINIDNYQIVEDMMQKTAKQTSHGDCDFKRWFKPIMDCYCSNLIVELQNNTLTINTWDVSNRLLTFIPDVPDNLMHTLTKKAEKRLILANTSSANSKFITQASFRLKVSHSGTFMVVLQIIGNHNWGLCSFIKSNNRTVGLHEVLQDSNQIEFVEYYLGKKDCKKWFSYLPVFKTLFQNNDGTMEKYVNVALTFYCNKSIIRINLPHRINYLIVFNIYIA